MPLVRPEITNGLVVEAAVCQPPLLSWYWYEVIGSVPALPAVNAALNNVSPGVREFSVGAPGFASGTTEARGDDATPVPTAFEAATAT